MKYVFMIVAFAIMPTSKILQLKHLSVGNTPALILERFCEGEGEGRSSQEDKGGGDVYGW